MSRCVSPEPTVRQYVTPPPLKRKRSVAYHLRSIVHDRSFHTLDDTGLLGWVTDRVGSGSGNLSVESSDAIRIKKKFPEIHDRHRSKSLVHSGRRLRQQPPLHAFPITRHFSGVGRIRGGRTHLQLGDEASQRRKEPRCVTPKLLSSLSLITPLPPIIRVRRTPNAASWV